MKTVYDWFCEYAQGVLMGRDQSCKENVTAGIRAFLTEMDMLEESDPDGKVSRRELLRFKMMPADTFTKNGRKFYKSAANAHFWRWSVFKTGFC